VRPHAAATSAGRPAASARERPRAVPDLLADRPGVDLASAGGFGRVALFASATAAVSAIVIAVTKESSRTDLTHVGGQPAPTVVAVGTA
jgi:hypothetical protein